MRSSKEDLDWIIAGDFNAKLSSRDQEGGTPFLDPGDRFMIAQVQALHLVDIKCPGINYTWTNKRREPHSRKVKLDHFLVSEEAFVKWNINFQILEGPASDHCPILLEGRTRMGQHHKPFRFENFRLQKEELQEKIP